MLLVSALFLIGFYTSVAEAAGSDVLPASYKKLNTAEKKLCKSYPREAALVYAASTQATKRTNALFKTSSIHNANGDAFRHAYWNAELVQSLGISSKTGIFNVTNGKKRAKVWTDAHETTKGQPKLEKKMDLFNNKVGRDSVPKSLKKFNAEKTILKKLNNGDLKRLSKNKLVKTNNSGRKKK